MRGDVDRVEEDVADVGGAVAGDDADGIVDVARVHRETTLENAVELRQHARGELARRLVAADRHRLAADADADAERALDRLQVLVVVAEELVEETVIRELELGTVRRERRAPSVACVRRRRTCVVVLGSGICRTAGRGIVAPVARVAGFTAWRAGVAARGVLGARRGSRLAAGRPRRMTRRHPMIL